MSPKNFDQRIIPLLRLSILIQIFFYLITFILPQHFPGPRGQALEIQPLSFISIILMTLIFSALYVPFVLKRLSKTGILLILFAQTIITLGSRYFFSLIVERIPLSPSIGLTRWDTLIFLIIPLMVIAWQFEFKHVIAFCILVTLMECIPISILTKGDWYFFGILSSGAIGRGIILGIIGWLEFRLIEIQRQQQKQLQISNTKLRQHALTAERLAQSQERNRIARELHDTLAHTLSSVSVQLEAVKALYDVNPKEAKSLLDKTLENTHNGLKETRRALKDLRASELENYGLTKSIINLLNSSKERGNFNFETQISTEADSLPDEIIHCLYRIIQEAMENVIRHSRAKNVDLNLYIHKNDVHLQIVDDGVGFNLNELNDRENFGVQGMKERVEALGGDFQIKSMNNQGTTIDIHIARENDKNFNL